MSDALNKKSWAKTLFLYALLIMVGVTTIIPLVWMLSTSVKGPSVPFSNFLPGAPTAENYAKVFQNHSFARYYFNSAFISIVITLGQLLVSAMAAYAFSRLTFPGRDKIFFIYLATMMVPHTVTMVPEFIILTRAPFYLNQWFHTTLFTDALYLFNKFYAGKIIGMDSYFVLIFPSLFNPYGTFLLRQFFLTIPKEIDEAAMIDGCSKFSIFSKVILPLSTPALATLAIFTFMGSWGNFLWPLIMTNNEALKTLPVGLTQFMSEYSTDWPVLMAGSALMLVPMIIVFIACQRFFISGIQIGAVKG